MYNSNFYSPTHITATSPRKEDSAYKVFLKWQVKGCRNTRFNVEMF